jgi:hypothetical protein
LTVPKTNSTCRPFWSTLSRSSETLSSGRIETSACQPGRSFPLGATLVSEGANFSVFAKHSTTGRIGSTCPHGRTRAAWQSRALASDRGLVRSRLRIRLADLARGGEPCRYPRHALAPRSDERSSDRPSQAGSSRCRAGTPHSPDRTRGLAAKGTADGGRSRLIIAVSREDLALSRPST